MGSGGLTSFWATVGFLQSMPWSGWTGVVVALAVAHWLFLLRKRLADGIPGPMPLPLIGNGHLFLGDLMAAHRTMEGLARRYGKVFRLWLGADEMISACQRAGALSSDRRCVWSAATSWVDICGAPQPHPPSLCLLAVLYFSRAVGPAVPGPDARATCCELLPIMLLLNRGPSPLAAPLPRHPTSPRFAAPASRVRPGRDEADAFEQVCCV